MQGSKVCSRCKEDKPLYMCHVFNRAKDGRQLYCKECKALWGQNYKPFTNERKRANYANNPHARDDNRARYNANNIAHIGCGLDQWQDWLDATMPDGFTRDDINNGLHKDHVIPLSRFNINNYELANRWYNRQLLTEADNITKRNQIDPCYINLQIKRLEAFEQEHPEYEPGLKGFLDLLDIVNNQ
jgi:hypothetical protein